MTSPIIIKIIMVDNEKMIAIRKLIALNSL